MSDRLAKQVASVIVGPPVMGDSGRFISGETLSALAELVEAGHRANDYAKDYGCGDEWDEALRRVGEALGITTKQENT